MKNKIVLCAAALALFCRMVSAQATVTLNTYYPSPLGVYTSIVTSSTTLLASQSGRVGISTGIPQGVLDVNSTTSGFLPPRMTATQMNAITAPVAGMVVYNTTSQSLNVYNGSSWGPTGTMAIATGDAFGGYTGTSACASMGKTCVYTFSVNYLDVDDGIGTAGVTRCGKYYNTGLTGVTQSTTGDGAGSIHACSAALGTQCTYLVVGLVQCNAMFNAICQ